jgi:hypothetical protein
MDLYILFRRNSLFKGLNCKMMDSVYINNLKHCASPSLNNFKLSYSKTAIQGFF